MATCTRRITGEKTWIKPAVLRRKEGAKLKTRRAGLQQFQNDSDDETVLSEYHERAYSEADTNSDAETFVSEHLYPTALEGELQKQSTRNPSIFQPKYFQIDLIDGMLKFWDQREPRGGRVQYVRLDDVNAEII